MYIRVLCQCCVCFQKVFSHCINESVCRYVHMYIHTYVVHVFGLLFAYVFWFQITVQFSYNVLYFG